MATTCKLNLANNNIVYMDKEIWKGILDQLTVPGNFIMDGVLHNYFPDFNNINRNKNCSYILFVSKPTQNNSNKLKL